MTSVATAFIPCEGLNKACCLMCMCSCNEGYEGVSCQVATSTSDLALLVSLSTLLPVAAILVVIITIILIYRRLKTTQDVTNSRRHRQRVRPGYDGCMCSDQFEFYCCRYFSITFQRSVSVIELQKNKCGALCTQVFRNNMGPMG